MTSMTKKLIGVFASVALMSSGLALAHDKSKQETQTQSQSSTGGSGSAGMGQQQSGQRGKSGQMGASEQLGGNQLTGRVVKSEAKTIYVEHAGAIVPLKIDKNTQFTDPSLKRATDIKEGDQIRASFEVRKTDNVATSIGMSSGMNEGQGGSGSDVLSPDQGINQPSNTLPPSGGTGGSGNLGSDINEGSSPNSGASSGSSSGSSSGDMSHDQSKTSGDY
jgi:opacity protein-like surface antigen